MAASAPTAHRITVHPEITPAGAPGPNVTFGCQARPMDGTAGPRCYQPAQIQNAYNITPLLSHGINGAGRTINVAFGFQPTDPVFFIIGGTSAGSPQWAGLAADADQLGHHRMGNINPALYSIAQAKKFYAAALHDITIGDNDVAEIGGQGFNAGTGWDPVTGLGSPNAAVLVPLLLNWRPCSTQRTRR